MQSFCTSKLKLVDTVLTPDASEGCGIEAITVIVYTPTSDCEVESIENDRPVPENDTHPG
jgi:hypothetical protein